jgi:acyl transferase domain-containing protein
MSLRSDLNGILTFIGTSTLTDEEYEIADEAIEDSSDSSEVYNGLTLVLDERELVSTMHDRLKYYYLAKGVSFTVDTAKSNIFVGDEI